MVRFDLYVIQSFAIANYYTAIAKNINSMPASPYISFALQGGRSSNIFYESSGATDIRKYISFESKCLTNS